MTALLHGRVGYNYGFCGIPAAMFSYFKNKILKVEEDSPNKQQSRLSPSECIYLEQLQNYIDVEGGYQVLKNKLTHEINSNYCYDSPFISEITILLRNTFSLPTCDKVSRALDVVEDLVAICGQVCNEAFNDFGFCEELEKLAVNAHFKSKVLGQWQTVCSRAAGIIFFLAKKYENQGNSYVFGKSLRTLLERKIDIPQQPSIREVESKQTKKKTQQHTLSQQSHIEILNDASQFLCEAESRVKSGEIDTMYVRSIKAKTKVLYELASTGGGQMSQKERDQVSQTYKRLRTVLKQIQKKNNENLSTKAIEEEKKYLQNKVSGLSGKKEKHQVKEESSPKKQTAEVLEKQEQKTPIKKQQNLLDMEDDSKEDEKQNVLNIQIETVVSKQAQQEESKYRTPVKDRREGELADLLSEGDGSSGKLNLQKMYELSAASKQFESLSLVSSPEQLVDKKQEFGEFL